jgi:hypothetical protein
MSDYNVKNYIEQGAERTVIGGSLDVVSGGDLDVESGAALKIGGVQLTATPTQLNKLVAAFTVTALDGSAGKKACVTNGVSAITGGTGIADMTLAAPSVGDLAIIRINSLSSGSVVVTTAAGVTFDGTNNTATFDAANESLVLAYKSATQWQIVLNVGGTALSAVGGG